MGRGVIGKAMSTKLDDGHRRGHIGEYSVSRLVQMERLREKRWRIPLIAGCLPLTTEYSHLLLDS